MTFPATHGTASDNILKPACSRATMVEFSSFSGRGQKKMKGVAKPVAGSCPKMSRGCSKSGADLLVAMLLDLASLWGLEKDPHGGCGVLGIFLLE